VKYRLCIDMLRPRAPAPRRLPAPARCLHDSGPIASLDPRMDPHLAAPPTPQPLTLTINGETRQLEVEPWTSLLDLLRNRLDLTGTKKGCDHGQCGACTVLVGGKRVLSCLTLAIRCDGGEITTIEGLSETGELHPLQKAFVEHDALQCGYCTPGQIMSAVGLLSEGRARTADEIRELMSGNLCRCGAYTNIVDAIEDVMQQRFPSSQPSPQLGEKERVMRQGSPSSRPAPQPGEKERTSSGTLSASAASGAHSQDAP
jgi:xanthine dehydrogenase YagT iron-sulfur-binding subunit